MDFDIASGAAANRSGSQTLTAAARTTGGQVLYVEIEGIESNPFQPRRHFDPAAIEVIARSIQRHGLVQYPVIRCVDGKHEIVCGHRRIEACRLLGWTRVPTIVAASDSADTGLLALAENLHREDLHPLDEARAIADYMARSGRTQAQVGRDLCRSQSAVSNTLILLNLPRNIQESYYRQPSIPKSVALEVARIKDHDEQMAAWKMASARGLTVREARRQKRAGGAQASHAWLPTELAVRRALSLLDAMDDVTATDPAYPELRKIVCRVARFMQLLEGAGTPEGQ